MYIIIKHVRFHPTIKINYIRMKTKMVLLAMIAFSLVQGIGCKKELNIEFVDVSVPDKKCDMPDNYSLV